MITYMQYQEVEAPKEIQDEMQQLVTNPGEKPVILSSTGFFDWLSEQTKGGWRPVWYSFNFPYVVMEREVSVEETEK